jgi:hypothetical protein
MTTRRHLLLLTWLAVIAAPAAAHDLWLVPGESYAVGKAALVRANVGMAFPESVHAPDPTLFKRRILIKPDGTEGLLEPAGKEDESGVLRFVPDQLGTYVLAVQTRPKLVSLEAGKFNEYLVTDGLSHIFLLRAKEGSLDQKGKERYSKSVKTLIQVGHAGEGDPSRILGLPLEVVPLRDPFRLKAGSVLPVRVMFQGKPLPEANLGWQHPGDGPVARGYVRTDRRGEALIPIARGGLMTLRLTHMTRPKARDYEWESFWTTLTFRVPQ